MNEPKPYQLRLEKRRRDLADEVCLTLRPDDVVLLKQKAHSVRLQNQVLSGRVNSEANYGSRLTRIHQLIRNNGYVENGPQRHVIDSVLAEKSGDVLALKEEQKYLEAEKQRLKRELALLRRKDKDAPREIRNLQREVVREQGLLYLTINAEQFRQFTPEDVRQKQQELSKELETVRGDSETIELENEQLASQLVQLGKDLEKAKARQEALKAKKPAEHSSGRTQCLIQTERNLEQEDKEEEDEESREELLCYTQKVVERAVREKLELKKSLLRQVESIEKLKNEWLDIILRKAD